jgi:hypothetical protein
MRISEVRGAAPQPVVVKGLENVPVAFSETVKTLVDRAPQLEAYREGMDLTGRIVLQFGGNLPSAKNLVVVTSRYLNKARQAQELEGVVPTIATYEHPDDIAGEYIAKMKTGHKQIGQKINAMPDNPEDYVFQPLVNIVAEFRVVVFYMNGKYHVSGVYKKTGSNMSLQSITGSAADELGKVAVKATEALGYGFSGVDVAVVDAGHGAHVRESVLGSLASAAGRVAGSFSNVEDLIRQHKVAVLEVNKLPSMANPMIAHDLIKNLYKHAT